jgi:hypothetical protein
VTTPDRPTGVYGKRPPKNHPAIELGPLLTGIIPAHPAAADYLRRFPAWRMLGNGPDPEVGPDFSGAGDCVSVTWAGMRRLVTAVLGTREVYASLDWVWQVYRTQNPGFDPNGTASTNGPGSSYDNGMDIQTLLEYLVKTGGPDGVKAVAFAKVDHTSPDQVKAAIAIFGSVWTGTAVLDTNEDEFSWGEPWDYSASGQEVGLHSVLVGGYGPEGPGTPAVLGGDEKLITWAQETSFTDSFWSHEVDECWAVIWPEHGQDKAFLAGVNKTALEAAYTQLTGRFIVWPDMPIPPDPPDPHLWVDDYTADQAFYSVLTMPNEAGQPWDEQRHSGYVTKVASAARAWIAARTR